MVPGSLETAVSKAGSNHCLFGAACWQPKQQQAQPSRSRKRLVTLEWPTTGKLEREGGDFQGKQLIRHLYKHEPYWSAMGVLGEWLRETGGIINVRSQAAARGTCQPHTLRCQKPPASQSCFIPSRFVKSKPHQLRGGDCTGLLSQDQHLWPYFHTTGDTYSFPTFWSMASS